MMVANDARILRALSDSLEAFWNASLGSTRQHGDATANVVVGGIAEGVAAVASRLQEHAIAIEAEEKQKEGIEAYGKTEFTVVLPAALYLWAHSETGTDPIYEAARQHVREMLK